jgi:hypothetical protein
MHRVTKQTLLFLHIPKSAGTTLASCLTDNYYNYEYVEAKVSQYERMQRFYEGDIFYYPEGFYKDPLKDLPAHMIPFLNQPDLRVVTGHFSYGIHKHIQAEAKYITILRDPVERVVSLYYHLLNTEIINKGISLELFLEGIPSDGWLVNLTDWFPVKPKFTENEIRECSRCMLDNDQTRRISGMEPPFGNCNESIFRLACQNIAERFILVGLTERFDESLLMLSHKLGWEKVRYVPKLKNRAKPNLTALPQHLLSKIEQLNYWDRKLYEYASKLFENNIKALGPDFKDKISQFSQSNKKYIENNEAKGWDIGVDGT